MAKIGMEYVVSAKLSEAGDTATYADGKYWGPTSSINVSPNVNDVKDYGDDRVVETDTSVTNAGISVELNENTLELEAFLLGHTYEKEKKELSCSVNDIAPFVGTGFVGKSKNNGKVVYRGVWLTKCQFKSPNDDNSTKQESTTFNHTTFEGTAYYLKSGVWREKAEFDTLEEAKAWLDKKANIVAE